MLNRECSLSVWLRILFSLWILCLSPNANAKAAQEPLGAAIESNDTLVWGPYRPNLYFGVRPRIPKSLLTGLLWVNGDSFQTIQPNFRHTCEQHEGMAGYGWEEYDTRKGGRQIIRDTGNKIDITIDFVKVPGGSHGGGWAAKIKGSLRDDASPNLVTSVFFYASMDGLGQLGFPEEQDQTGTVTLQGETAELGTFTIDVTEGSNNRLPHRVHKSWDDKPLDRTLITSAQVPPEHVWQAKNVIFADIKQEVEAYVEKYGQEDMPPPWQAFTISDHPRPGNFHVVQKVLVGNFSFDVLFSSGSAPKVTSEQLTTSIAKVSENFKSKFRELFTPLAPFDQPKYTPFSESMFSNLCGGIGYFYGDSLVDRSYAVEYDEDNEGFWEETAAARSRAEVVLDQPTELFTSVPSRPFFPRGFLWDEGFHLIPIVEWDLDLTIEIVRSWFDLMDLDGWIAREQILGAEARSKVPEEFQVQYPHYANPPTLFMIIEIFAEKLKSGKLSKEHVLKMKEQLEHIYPLLKRQYSWFRKTQFGDIKSYEREAFSTKEAYRWRGRTPQHILTSGLDDYPRPQPPHPGELHTDLISWVGMMARTLSNLATVLSETDDAKTYSTHYNAIQRNIDDLHWSAKDKLYCDSTIDDYEESIHVCHKGYISIFPFMTGLLPASHPNLPHILNLISDPAEMWSDYGIRSLSQTDPFYGTDENYWRSPIWVNMNYLILKNLLTVATSTDKKAPAKVKEQARKIYVDLRKNLVENVFQQWEETGFAWEQYNPDTGKGQRTQHFTGWTSLVVVIMRMPDLSDGVKHSEL